MKKTSVLGLMIMLLLLSFSVQAVNQCRDRLGSSLTGSYQSQQGGHWSVVGTRRGCSNSWDMDWTGPGGQKWPQVLSIVREGGKLSAMPNDQSCSYKGTVNGGDLTGTHTCGGGGTFNFYAW